MSGLLTLLLRMTVAVNRDRFATWHSQLQQVTPRLALLLANSPILEETLGHRVTPDFDIVSLHRYDSILTKRVSVLPKHATQCRAHTSFTIDGLEEPVERPPHFLLALGSICHFHQTDVILLQYFESLLRFDLRVEI